MKRDETLPRSITYIIDQNYDGKKVNDYLKYEGHFSHKMITELKKEENGITLNGQHIRTVDYLTVGDNLTVNIPDDTTQSTSIPTQMPLKIIYEDDDIIVINKPAMLSVHESHNHLGDTLSNGLAYYLNNKEKPSVFRAVGRLDKGTSGLVVCALNRYSASKLSGKIYKEYLAVASNVFNGEGTIDAPIYRPDPIKTVRTVDNRGEKAVTHWKAIKNDERNTLLRIHLETGRTHQIRVHFASIEAPLVGDTMYGTPNESICHQALHCCYCRFTHPVSNKEIECYAEMPDEMKNLI